MEIIVGKNAGFCYGVDNAVTKSEKYIENNKNVYCLGELVHNKHVIERLQEKGLVFVNNVSEIKKEDTSQVDTVIVRAHGEPKSTYEQLKENKIKILDLTCPNVLAIHKLVEEYVLKGYYIFLIGKKKHPETIGTQGFCNGKCSIIENEDDINLAFNQLVENKMNKIFVISQTTFNFEKFENYAEKIKSKTEKLNYKNKNYNIDKKKSIELEIKNTICNATKIRQDEVNTISKQVKCMIIIGGKNSSNTRKLYDIAKENCTNSIIVEDYKELIENKENNMIDKPNINELKKIEKIGIMAGASTPVESIKEVIKFLESL